ncbi:hypothetical protein HaLaN_01164 [Haematococcus lacustris]|uniref:Uncharacterized protein n=1 Tax=Haematococcus lacustris TaxID=44745 RepID=A0A699YKI7_HAELA|nr:hypothetical protein HaLaN_01164 [Haematococcus lacustris]
MTHEQRDSTSRNCGALRRVVGCHYGTCLGLPQAGSSRLKECRARLPTTFERSFYTVEKQGKSCGQAGKST